MSKAKGMGGAGCCCGGCAQKPLDGRVGQEDANALLQATCCRCIPNKICIQVAQYGYETQTITTTRDCGSTEYLGGNAIQYTTTISISEESVTLNVRMFVEDSECYIGWDIPELYLEDSVLVDRTVPSTVCNLNMEPKKCSEFGGEWMFDDVTLTISEAPSRNVKDLIECAGCDCICDCMCFSIWSREDESIWDIVKSNETVCAVLTNDEYLSGCGIDNFWKVPRRLTWTIDGWILSLYDRTENPIYTHTVDSGTESISGTCSAKEALYLSDGYTHTIEGEAAQVTYEWTLDWKIAKSYKWVGRTNDINAVLTIEAYDWVNDIWVEQDTREGRADDVDINMVSVGVLTDEYTGTGDDLGKVKIRLTTTGSRIISDMMRVTTSDCCYLTLTPPDDVIPVDDLPIYVISGECPSPTPTWQFTDYNGVLWNFSADCRWCGTACGSKTVHCCGRLIPRFLFAEVQIDCPGCVGTAFTVPLDSGETGTIWDGCTRLCDTTGDAFCMTISCGSPSWVMSVQTAPGGCTLAGATVNSTSASCDPISITFTGTLQAGTFCCGAAGGVSDTPTITVTVIE